jgi:hypothetical protein
VLDLIPNTTDSSHGRLGEVGGLEVNLSYTLKSYSSARLNQSSDFIDRSLSIFLAPPSRSDAEMQKCRPTKPHIIQSKGPSLQV